MSVVEKIANEKTNEIAEITALISALKTAGADAALVSALEAKIAGLVEEKFKYKEIVLRSMERYKKIEEDYDGLDAQGMLYKFLFLDVDWEHEEDVDYYFSEEKHDDEDRDEDDEDDEQD